jgi:hypothetical protein
VPALDDKKVRLAEDVLLVSQFLLQALYVARRPETASEKAKRIKNPKWWVRVVLFICCVSPSTDSVH